MPSCPFRATPSGAEPEPAPEVSSESGPVPLGPKPSTNGEAASGPRGRRFKSCLPDSATARHSEGFRVTGVVFPGYGVRSVVLSLAKKRSIENC